MKKFTIQSTKALLIMFLCSFIAAKAFSQGFTLTSSQTNVSCNGGTNGSITLTISAGAIPPYTFLWSNSATTQNLTGLSAGVYSVTVTDSVGYVDSLIATITQPSVLTVSVNVIQNVLCYGGSTGSAYASISGGTAGFTYNWSNSATTDTIVNLNYVSAGYHVTVTDANGCTKTASATITQPSSALSVSIPSTSAIDVSCYGTNTGSLVAIAAGGTTSYSYSWSNSESAAKDSMLVAGTYIVTATDANGCTSTSSATITQPSLLSATIQAGTTVNVSCFGGNNGIANVSTTGGTTPYASYSWSNSESGTKDSMLVAGTYLVTVTDAKGCTATTSATVTQPALLRDSINSTNVACHGVPTGTIAIYPYGGTPSYTFNWSNGAPPAQSKTGLSPGTYYVTITDSKGCTAVDSSTITQPSSALVDSVITRNILCYGGTVDSAWVIASGGTAGYNYLWTGGSLVSSGVYTDTITNVTPATYTLRVTDAHGCTVTKNVTISQPQALVAYFDAGRGAIVNVLCNGGNNGSANVSVIGGTTPYSFAWSNSETGQKDSNLVAGIYYVTVSDAHGCTAVDSVTITQPSALTLSLSTAMYGSYNIQCNGGSSKISPIVGGGIPAYSYLWQDSSTGGGFSGIAGTYYVTVTDQNGCVISDSITLTQPPAIIDSISSPLNGYGFNVSCSYNGVCAADGSINLSVGGGVAGYSYSWNNTLPIQNPTGLCAGFYSVTITDTIGCQHIDTITLTTPSPLGAVGDSAHVYSNYSNVSCDTCKDGQIWALPTLGTAPYSYQWSNQNMPSALFVSDTLQTITNCGPWGIYYVTVGDVNGCRAVSPPIFLSNAVYSDWRTTGNYGNNAWLGTVDSTDLIIKTNDFERMRVTANGSVNINRLVTNKIVSAQDSIGSVAFGDSTLYIATSGYCKIWNDGLSSVKGIGIGKGYMPPCCYACLCPYPGTIAYAVNSTAIGYNVRTLTGADNSVIIGSSYDNLNDFDNTIKNSLMVGFNSNLPTLFVTTSNGIGTTGNIRIGYNGIGNTTPMHQLEVDGNVSLYSATSEPSALIFGQEVASTGVWGEWGIEYDKNGGIGSGGLNFWKPSGSDGTLAGNGFGNNYLFLGDNGNIGIGMNTPSYKLDVCGEIRSKGVWVNLSGCDFVFEEDYSLLSIKDLSDYIMQNHHLPGIASAKEMESSNVSLGEFNSKLLQKVEELTLYIIDQQKQIDELKLEIKQIKK